MFSQERANVPAPRGQIVFWEHRHPKVDIVRATKCQRERSVRIDFQRSPICSRCFRGRRRLDKSWIKSSANATERITVRDPNG